MRNYEYKESKQRKTRKIFIRLSKTYLYNLIIQVKRTIRHAICSRGGSVVLIWIIDEEWKDYDMEREYFEEVYPGAEIRCSSYDYEEDLTEFGYRADGILAQVYAPIPKATIDRLECCKGIAVYGGGYERVDTKAAREKGIGVTNISGYCAPDLADYVVAAMYFANKNIAGFSQNVLEGAKRKRWGMMAVDRIPHRLCDEILGIYGFGVIGKEVAKHAQAVGMTVIACDDFVSGDQMNEYGVRKVSCEELFETSDYISINLKGCPENEYKVSSRELSRMKETAWLINTSRGLVIHEDDLIAAVKETRIAGAILDVIRQEPPTGDEKILDCPGIYVTPHVSYASVESFRALKEFALSNLTAMLDGKTPRDLVN